MIHLEKITWENYSTVAVGLKLDEEQQKYLGNNELSLVQAYVSSANDEYPWLPFAVCSDDKVVGFTMIAYNSNDNGIIKEKHYGIYRFMIAKKYQGKGYGREALNKIIEKIKTFPYGEAPAIYLSTKHENVVAKNLFLSVGFVETGENDEDGDALARLAL